MFTTCMYCKKPLGSNEVIESFPVGRRLAFDAARGRLWVVCRKCERWNLTPLEERWEAVEDCERIFRGTRVRASTENIGLARHPEGLTLVRIGEPLRPEFAAWRYGDQFGRRRRKVAVYGGVVIAAATGLAVGGLVAGAAISTVLLPFQVMQIYLMGGANWRRVRVRLADGRALVLKRHLGKVPARLRPADGDGMGFRIEVEMYSLRRGTERFRIEGEAATGAAATILATANASGGTEATVQDAVGRIEATGSAESLISDLAAANDFKDGVGRPGLIGNMPEPTRLALEMALHEEQERRALEGELWLLEQAWRDAEELAAISDDLLLPEAAQDFVRERGLEGDAGDSGRAS
ncbi:MAG: hypothetical protein OXQ94_17080 [Gemmatimonadota bacterium]|nr:hypothetical protein [Gemmatimonadota bacterium]MDE2873394.1 hypothetical protein [Gemmatimonadota bacterium]